jgi:hypothetical protein
MAKIRVTPEFLAEALFPGATVTIAGAGFDAARQLVVLDVDGPSVPEAEEITAECSVTLGGPEPRRIVETAFKAI